MRWWVLVVLTACGLPPPPKQTVFPTLALDETYHTRISNLRTTLGRAGITLRVAGQATTFETANCDPAALRQGSGNCARCTLGAEPTADGALIEATTRAFARYPTAVLERAKITHVAICRDIVLFKEPADEHPAGLADIYGHGLLLSLGYFKGTYTGRGSFTVDDIAHHELFHLLEYELMRATMFDDPMWRLANPVGFEYQDEYRSDPRRDGFVDAYAATAVHEDKASVYEYLMAHPDELCELAKVDEVVRTKVTIIWQRVAAAVGTDSFMRAAAPCVDWIDA